MKIVKLKILTFCGLVLFSFSGFAQKQWETEIVLGINHTNYDIHYYDWQPRKSYQIDLKESWFKKSDSKFSLVKEFGISLRYQKIDYGYGGHAGHSYYDGFYLYSSWNAALLPQIKIGNGIWFQVGPKAEGLIAGYWNTDKSWYFMQSFDETIRGNSEIKEFTRDYLDQLYWGITAKFLSTKLLPNKKIGVSATLLFTQKERSNFESNKIIRLELLYRFGKKEKQ